MQPNTSLDDSLVLYHLSSDSAYYTILSWRRELELEVGVGVGGGSWRQELELEAGVGVGELEGRVGVRRCAACAGPPDTTRNP